jgi:integrase
MSGDGSLYQRKSDKIWVAQITRGPRGHRTIIRRYRKSKAEARLELDKLRETAGRVDNKTTVGAYLRGWLDGAGKTVLKPSTWETYEIAVRRQIIPAIGDIPLSRLEATDIDRMAATLRRSMTSKGVRNVLSVLSRILAVAERRRQIVANPVRYVEGPRGGRPKTKDAMTSAVGRQVRELVAGDRLEALYVLTLAAGLRQAEVLGLHWDDVDLEQRTVRIASSLDRVEGRYVLTDTKNDVVATLALPAFAVESLRAHRARQLQERVAAGMPTEDGLVFVSPAGRPINGGWLSHHWRKISRAAGLDLTFHALRHGHTDILIDRKVHPKVIQARDRHSTITMTMDRYGHVTSEQDRAAAAELEAAIG